MIQRKYYCSLNYIDLIYYTDTWLCFMVFPIHEDTGPLWYVSGVLLTPCPLCGAPLVSTLCDNLRRERDRAVSDLADALRNLDDTRKQKNDAARELKELK